MPLPYLDASLRISSKSPQEYYRDEFQKLLDDQFGNASNVYTIKEEYPFASGEYRDITVRIAHVINNETGEKLGDDYKTILFSDLEHATHVGNYYQFYNNHWIVINTDRTYTLSATVTVKRCNNVLRWMDENGGLHKVPCSIDYPIKENRDYATAGSAMVTPSGLLEVITQFNTETNMIQPNQRFLIGNPGNWVAIKVQGGGINNFNNLQTLDNSSPGTIKLSMAVTYENSDTDDMINGIADNKQWVYALTLDKTTVSLGMEETAQLAAVITKNGETVTRTVEWASSDVTVATVNTSGLVTPVSLGTCTITCNLKDNSAIKDTVAVTVEETPTQDNYVVVIPERNYVLEGQSQTYSVYLYLDDARQADTFTISVSGSNTVPSTYYRFSAIDGNSFSVTNVKMYLSAPLKISCVTGEHNREFEIALKGAW